MQLRYLRSVHHKFSLCLYKLKHIFLLRLKKSLIPLFHRLQRRRVYEDHRAAALSVRQTLWEARVRSQSYRSEPTFSTNTEKKKEELLTSSVSLTESLMSITRPPFTTIFGNLFRN